MNPKRRAFLTGLASLGATALMMPPDSLAQPSKQRRVLLAHGLFGFSKIGALSYFNGVRNCFDSDCIFLEPSVAPAGSIRERAKQLEQEITNKVPKKELDQGGTIHIVAHSMGGLDARYLISSSGGGLGHAKWFASLTTISTPHQGSPIADIVMREHTPSLDDLLGIVDVASADTILSVLKSVGKTPPPGIPLKVFAPAAILEALGDFRSYVGDFFGTPPDAFSELTTNSCKTFNTAHPSLEGVPLFCYAGISNPNQTMCRGLFASWVALMSIAGVNDGVVPASSSRWNDHVPKVATDQIVADHVEEVGLGALLDGLPTRDHFPVCNLYQKINAWQKVHGSA
jgi:hypothetical protein